MSSPIRDLMWLGPVIPVIVIDDRKLAVPLARALVARGVRVLELRPRTPAVLAARAAGCDALKLFPA